ncbi:1,4-alpha-glucan branching protein GlgB [Jonesia quinghaiensis]|uniref:1,4-alpha-glucan branching protein GlgB n=1 Tax=Jonesia quinghaiensis TaxID=262806 RepID=UPI0003FA0AEA|nr:1,4-alpha-glucan branching protein GlgB [Jonesia quinghaiensis]
MPTRPSTAPIPLTVDPETLTRIAHGTHHAPHSVLGPHVHTPERTTSTQWATVRVSRPLAVSVTLKTPRDTYPMTHELEGVWVAVIPAPGGTAPEYVVTTDYGSGEHTIDDAYRYLPTVTEFDQHLIREGRHEQLWTVLGANARHYRTGFGEVTGTSFAVWAPTARAVRVIGDFNGWDGRSHAMRSLGSSGVWELFLPGVGEGSVYKYEIHTADDTWVRRADPMARATEVPPATASIVNYGDYTWQDTSWMAGRAHTDPHTQPMSVYEVHLGSWRQGLSYEQAAIELVAHVKDMGFTHVEFLPVAEHPFGGSWGYQVTSYYAPTSRFGSPAQFKHLVDALHQAGIGVILDWVPAHFPKDEWALARFDGTCLYEHPNPQLGEHPDWGTLIFNYGRNEVRNFLVANASFWLEEFHIDALRVDAVASMLYLDYSRNDGEWQPNRHGGRENLEAIAFLQEANATAYRRNPGIMMIAEESTAFPGVTAPTHGGGLGFGLKWNMGWMNDTLRYIQEEPVNRHWHHGTLTHTINYAFSEQYLLPISHDEVVHGKGSIFGKMPGDEWQKFAGVRSLYAYQWAHPGKQLLFMGCEFAQRGEWREAGSLEWGSLNDPHHSGVRDLVRDLNEVYRTQPALWELDFSPEGFNWLEYRDSDHNTVSLVRHSANFPAVVVVANFAGVPHEEFRVPLPHGGQWREILNTDAATYGGSGVTNTAPITAEDHPWGDGAQHSAVLRVPPLGVQYLVPVTGR